MHSKDEKKISPAGRKFSFSYNKGNVKVSYKNSSELTIAAILILGFLAAMILLPFFLGEGELKLIEFFTTHWRVLFVVIPILFIINQVSFRYVNITPFEISTYSSCLSYKYFIEKIDLDSITFCNRDKFSLQALSDEGAISFDGLDTEKEIKWFIENLEEIILRLRL